MPEPFPPLDRTPVDGSVVPPTVWHLLDRLAIAFPARWVLVGAQMVLLHGLEHGQVPKRETTDVDVLVNVRVLPTGTAQVSRHLVETEALTFEGTSRDNIGHRFSNPDVTVDVLAPDHLGKRSRLETVGSARTIEVPAGTGLLRDARTCRVAVGDRIVGIPRPTLRGAIVGKAAALTLPDSRRHAEDIAFLCGLVPDPRALSADCNASDRRWLRSAAALLDEERVWTYAHDPARARASLRLLIDASTATRIRGL